MAAIYGRARASRLNGISALRQSAERARLKSRDGAKDPREMGVIGKAGSECDLRQRPARVRTQHLLDARRTAFPHGGI